MLLPVLFTGFRFPAQSYGVSKALAATAAGLVLARGFRRHGLRGDVAWSVVLHGLSWGFLGAKLHHLPEHANLTRHGLGTRGFTWYDGRITATIAVLVVISRHRLPLPLVSVLIAVPLSIASSIGRLGCLLSGDGTRGRPTDLPWEIAVPHGTVATAVAVHPSSLDEGTRRVCRRRVTGLGGPAGCPDGPVRVVPDPLRDRPAGTGPSRSPGRRLRPRWPAHHDTSGS